jgi:hypothetical protein
MSGPVFDEATLEELRRLARSRPRSQHKDAPAALGIGKTSFEKYVVPEVRCIRLGSMRVYPVAELERWLERHAERVLEDVAA